MKSDFIEWTEIMQNTIKVNKKLIKHRKESRIKQDYIINNYYKDICFEG